MDLGRVSLRARERALLAGGTRSGKSTFSEAMVVDWRERYRDAPVLMLDSKPRYRAEYTAGGGRAKGRYRKWAHGPTVPDSVVVESPDDIKLALSTGAKLLIAQGNGERDVPALVRCARAWLDEQGKRRLIVVDETMDFFRSNGSPVGGDDALVRVARAGAERDCAALYCTQRTQGIPAQLLEELTKLYLFRLDYRKDTRRLHEMGAPVSITPPTQNHVFKYWTKADYGKVYGPYRLELPRRR
jgi:hypothetical protein